MQFRSYFPEYCSSSGHHHSEAGGSVWALNNLDTIFDNGHYCNRALLSPSPDLQSGYNKEALKQTMLKHEAMFKNQIHELHRLHTKQKELMEEMKRTELYKRHFRLETIQSYPVVPQNSGQHTSHATSLPWANSSCSLPGISDSKTSRVPLSFADGGRTFAACGDTLHNAVSAKESEFLMTENKKVGKKILDLELPAYEYVDSETEQSSANEKVSEPSQMPISGLKGTMEAVDKSDKKISFHGISLASKTDHNNLHPCFKSEKSKCIVDLNEPIRPEIKAELMGCVTDNNDIQWHGEGDSGFHVMSKEISEFAQIRDVYNACSNVLHQPNNELAKELDSDDEAGNIIIDLNSSPRCSSARNSLIFESTEVKQERVLSPRSLPGPGMTSYMPTSDKLTLHTAVTISEPLLPTSSRKHDLERAPITVQALPCFHTSMPLTKKSSVCSPGLSVDTFSPNKILTSCDNPPSAPENHGSTECTEVSLAGISLRAVNHDHVHPNCSSNMTVSKNSVNGGKKLENLTGKLPLLEEVTQTECSAVSSDVCPSKTDQNTSGVKNFQSNEKDEFVDINVDCDHESHSECITTSTLVAEKRVVEELRTFKVGIDLNSCVNGDDSLVTPTEVELEAPASPENKESNRPRGESDGNRTNEKKMHNSSPDNENQSGLVSKCDDNESQVVRQNSHEYLVTPESKEKSAKGESDDNQMETPCFSWKQDTHEEEGALKIAAEAIITISSSGIQTCVDVPIFKACIASPNGHLDWFARLASSVVDCSKSEFGLVVRGKNKNHLFDDGMDYFEAMTLKLKETNLEDYCFQTTGPEPEVAVGVATFLQCKSRSGRSRSGRQPQQRKNFQNEILPSIASLSRCEVREDLQIIGGLMEASGTHWESSYLRNAGRNGLGRGRKRASVSKVTESMMSAKQGSSINEVHIQEKKLIDWGNITRGRRRPRCPAVYPRPISSQV